MLINGKALSQLRLLGQNTTDSWAASTADIDFSQFGRLGNLRSGEDLLLADGRPPSGSGLNSHGLSSVRVDRDRFLPLLVMPLIPHRVPPS